MRTLLKASMQVDAANKVIREGKLAALMDSTLQQLKPEAAYFGAENGKRTMYIVFDLQDPTQIPVLLEPLFEAFQAEITLIPVMNEKELKAGIGKLGKVAERAQAPS